MFSLKMTLALLCMSLLGTCVAQNTPEVQMLLQEAIEKTPGLPDWSQFFPALKPLGRRLQLASPCCVIRGSMQSMMAMGVPADSTNTFDLDPSYRQLLQHTLEGAGMSKETINLHLGKVLGDLLLQPLRALKTPVDILMAGPPCPPWAGHGNRNSTGDAMAKVFFQILVWTFYLIHCGGLLAVCLDNVTGILASKDNQESVMGLFVRTMEKFCPEFAWRVDTLHLKEYMWPQLRVRVFL
jgi:site-specific DNA-cytosine methylase